MMSTNDNFKVGLTAGVLVGLLFGLIMSTFTVQEHLSTIEEQQGTINQLENVNEQHQFEYDTLQKYVTERMDYIADVEHYAEGLYCALTEGTVTYRYEYLGTVKLFAGEVTTVLLNGDTELPRPPMQTVDCRGRFW